MTMIARVIGAPAIAVWPTPIPLFALGLSLGYLAYRTQSLVAPVVLHGLFNAVAGLAILYVYLGGTGGQNGNDTTSACRPPSRAA